MSLVIEPKVLPVRDVMAALRCSRSFVYCQVAASNLERVKLGRKAVFRAADVERLASQGTR
jgi:hypothetical protein